MVVVAKRERAIERSRLNRRLSRAIPLLIAGLLAIAYALVPQLWRDAIASGLGVTLAWLAGLGALVIALAVGGVLLLAAILFLIVPLRTHTRPAATVNGIAPVSVYLDIENGQVTAVDVRELMEKIRETAKGRPTDLLFYGNAEPKTEKYKQFWRHGFQPIDVPYKQLGKGTATNIADLGLALHAFERALFGPPGQTIIIISHDQGFLPLLYRLRGLGHSVAVWARDVQDSYKDAAKYLAGVTWTNLVFASMQDQAAPALASADVASHGKPQARVPAAPGSRHVASNTLAAPTLATIALAMESTRACIQGLEGKPNAVKRLRPALGEVEQHILDRIGYTKFSTASSRVECWLDHLAALGVLIGVAPLILPAPGPTSPDAAAALYGRFLAEVVEVVEYLADGMNRATKLSEVGARVGAAASPAAEPALAPLRALLAQGNARGQQHARYFCQCARALGMLDFNDTENLYIIRVASRAASGAAPDGSSAAPS